MSSFFGCERISRTSGEMPATLRRLVELRERDVVRVRLVLLGLSASASAIVVHHNIGFGVMPASTR